ncbi:putative pentatricopeptide repeat protein [Golovinomyces cichoracearum]|uniref:Putative pentatricopeptide repeat protein n=1 Tax=Golovinomyces cichoracearum TaxID=62708 RepID=A0A420IW49_9PEZI|nr:putative pentatricopeptide repeat protein [Golovinomyces cichoracearum]
MLRPLATTTLSQFHLVRKDSAKTTSLLDIIELVKFEKKNITPTGENCFFAQMALSASRLEMGFVSPLARASYCNEHTSIHKPSFHVWRTSANRLTRPKNRFLLRRWHSSATAGSDFGRRNKDCRVKSENQFSEKHTKEELLNLVDSYQESYNLDVPSNSECDSLYLPEQDLNYKALGESAYYYSSIPSADQETRETVKKLKLVLEMDPENLDLVYQIYRALPHSRVNYLDSNTRHKLLHVLSVVEFKAEHSMIRYLSVVDDLKAVGIPLTLSEWNSAISFVARYVRTTTETEVGSALKMWKEMEYSAGVKGDNVTFNILFDVSCRAGKFALAEMIYKEMEARGLEYTRYHRVTKIMFHGFKQDGDGVRAAYRELVQSGEIVDTVVLNAMISALIKAREPNSAENIYYRMKSAHLARANSPLPPTDFMGRRSVNKSLLRATQMAKGDFLKRDELQKRSIIAPDSITYLQLIEYFSVKAGDLDKTVVFLEEMKWFSIPVRGLIFVKLFRGFFAHGGVRYTSWTGVRLELVYQSFLTALDSDETDLFIAWWIVLWLLKAFGKCTDASRALSVWEELKTRWEPQLSDMEHLASVLDRFISQDTTRRKFAPSKTSLASGV